MKFHVNVKVVALVTVSVEADSKEDAMARAGELAVVPINGGTAGPIPPRQSWVNLALPDNQILVLDAIGERVLDALNEE